jgi:hypothetical protein
MDSGCAETIDEQGNHSCENEEAGKEKKGTFLQRYLPGQERLRRCDEQEKR